MKARAFDYVRPHTMDDALKAFAACAGEARYLAGGQSLLAALNLRLDAPDLLIDIAHIEALRGVELVGDMLRIGALTRHAEVLASPLVAAHAPLFTAAAAYVAHPAIRNKGTLGGSLALADPASEFPAVALALRAQIEIAGSNGARIVAADDFFRDLYETALAPGEMITAVHVPVRRPFEFVCFQELARRRGDYAIVGLAASATFDGRRLGTIRLVFSSIGPTPMRARHAESALGGRTIEPDDVRTAQDALSDDLSPDDDSQTSAAMRAHLARVLLGRVLADLRRQAAA